MNTRDLTDFTPRELKLAARLLSLLYTPQDHTRKLKGKITPEFNPESGYVFLIDDSFNVAMLNENHLEDWLHCPMCSFEGFRSHFKDRDGCCEEFIKSEF